MNEMFDPSDDAEQNVQADRSARRRWIVAGAAAGGLALGGVEIVQLATASDGDAVTVRTAAGAAATVDSETTDDGAPSETVQGDDAPPAGGPFDWAEFDKIFGPYDDCVRDRVGDVLPDWGELGDEIGGWVEAVEIDLDLPWADGSVLVEDGEGLPTWFDFGEGDGSITVTRSDGTISVETTGDVTEIDGSTFLDDTFGDVVDGDLLDALPALPEIDDETLAELDAAHEACADLLPDGADIEIGDLDLGEFDPGEFDLGELPIDLDGLDLGDIDLENLDLGELDLDALFDELTSRTD